MAKVKRSVLKEIVKECLLEILFEGIDSEPGYVEEPIREARRQKSRASRPSSKRKLAQAVEEQTKKKQSEEDTGKYKEGFVDSAVGELTQDPVMAAIYADTVATTLSEQREGRRVTSSDAAAVAVDSVDNMSDIFAGAGNWASIAFNETDK